MRRNQEGNPVGIKAAEIAEDGSPIQVRMYVRPTYFMVRLRSAIKQMLWSEDFVDVKDLGSVEKIRRACALTAGALAEHQCTSFGDVWDPSEIAKETDKMVGEFLTKLEEGPRR